MFVPGETGTVTKTYIPELDRLQIDVAGGGSINPMGVELGGKPLNTATFVLPINSNITINIKSGITTVNQSMALLPGAELIVAEGATLNIADAEPFRDENGNIVHYRGGNNLIVYDRDQWLKGYEPIYNNGYLVGATPVDGKFVYSGKRLQPVAYSPSWSDDHSVRTEADLVDAVVDINGTLITNGYIYTTIDIDLEAYFYRNELKITGGGAAVKSSAGTGKLIMQSGFGRDNITMQPNQPGDIVLILLPMVSARLQNPDGSYLDTMGAAAGAEFHVCEQCGQWYAKGQNNHTVEITWIVDGEDQTQEVCMGVAPVYLGGTPVKEGYSFLGWSTSADGAVLETLPAVNGGEVFFAIFEKEAAGLKGDLNGDGEVDAVDLTLLACHVGGIEELTDDTALANADVNGDGEIDAIDLTIHACFVGGIISEWNDYN